MGFAVPPHRAKVGKPDRMVWAIDGDGCFQMTARSSSRQRERVPIKVAILNNAYLGMVRQWQSCSTRSATARSISRRLPTTSSGPRRWAGGCGREPRRRGRTIEKANAVDDGRRHRLRVDYRRRCTDGPRRQSNDDIILGPAEGRGSLMAESVRSGSPPHPVGLVENKPPS